MPIARLLLQAVVFSLGALPWHLFRAFLPAWHLQEGAAGLRNKSDMIVIPGVIYICRAEPTQLVNMKRGPLDPLTNLLPFPAGHSIPGSPLAVGQHAWHLSSQVSTFSPCQLSFPALRNLESLGASSSLQGGESLGSDSVPAYQLWWGAGDTGLRNA